jgi:hypothetical protein
MWLVQQICESFASAFEVDPYVHAWLVVDPGCPENSGLVPVLLGHNTGIPRV